MKHLKKYKIFESLEDDLNKEELMDILIDFEHMGLTIELDYENTRILDFKGKDSINAFHLPHVGESYEALVIYLQEPKSKEDAVPGRPRSQEFIVDIDELEEIFEYMVKPYLEKQGLVFNYFYNTDIHDFFYFESIEKIKKWMETKDLNGKFKSTWFAIGFYKP